MHTPFFPSWHHRLAPMGSHLDRACRALAAATLSHLEERFGPCLPQNLFPKAPAKANSRDRIYTRPRTFWAMLWQAFNPKASGREVVRQLQALFQLQGGPIISSEDGAYCRAKGRLPQEPFGQALGATAAKADQQAPAPQSLQGRPVKIVDGSALTLPDTRKNRRAYPPLKWDRQPHFPVLRLVVLFSLLSGAIVSTAIGNLRTAELPLLFGLFDQLATHDILMGDRGYGNYVLLALLRHFKPGVDFIGRSARRVDARRRRKRLGKGDWLVVWKASPNPSLWLKASLRACLPEELTVRIVRGSCYVKGFRVRQVTLVTTLLDPEVYPAEEILQAYLRRWRLELCLDDLKTTLGMEMLRSLSPNMLRKEIYAHLIAHNLVRWTMAQAATQHQVALDRVSFKGTLDALRQFTHAMSQARSKAKRLKLWTTLLAILAEDLVPQRKGRREPRAVKRIKRKYPHLNKPRHRFTDRPKSCVRARIYRLRKQNAK